MCMLQDRLETIKHKILKCKRLGKGLILERSLSSLMVSQSFWSVVKAIALEKSIKIIFMFQLKILLNLLYLSNI